MRKIFLFLAFCPLLFAGQTRGWAVPLSGEMTLALNDFRSLPEGSWEGNWGAFAQMNVRAHLPRSFLLQLAGSYGIYDWYGRTSSPTNSDSLQQQGFLTGALSRLTPHPSGVNWGLAYDGMFNQSLGVFAVNPFLSQVRGQAGYLIQEQNELGLWATLQANTAHLEAQQLPLQFRAINQVNLFWCHYFKNRAYTMLWAGTPYQRGLLYSSGRAGDYLFGFRFFAPLSHTLSLSGTAAYMGARGAEKGNGSKNYAANICLGLTYSFGHRSRATPYMSPADNTNFLVDTNLNL